MAGEKKPRLRLTLFPRAEVAVRAGHPWVYADSIKSLNREGDTGELAVIYDRRDRFLAIGLFERDSPIRVRILQAGGPATVDREFWLGRARECLGKRKETVLTDTTNGARLINGESEGFPGIVADQYADCLVVKVYSAGWLARWEEIEGVFREVFSPEHLVLRMSRNVAEHASRHGLEEGFRGEPGSEVVVFSENGLLFESAVLRGQKTGFFLDQRDNRARVELLSKDREVLNVFSFSGGFSVYAARGGAASVTDLDISAHALDSADRNFSLNGDVGGVGSVERHRVQADAFRWMDESREQYDLIITDPPSLAKRQAEKDGALAAYRRLNRRAVGMLRRGGVLVAASCSAHVSKEEFHKMIEEVLQGSGRAWKELWRSGHAADHPADFREAEYLKAICIEFD